jgi:hypothetical protein
MIGHFDNLSYKIVPKGRVLIGSAFFFDLSIYCARPYQAKILPSFKCVVLAQLTKN